MQEKDFIFGIHAVEAALQQGRVTALYVIQDKQNNKLKRLISLAKTKRCDIQLIKQSVFEQRYAQGNHQGVAATVKPTKQFSEKDIESLCNAAEGQLLILVLDGVTDPHNLGACLRSADAGGVDMVIVPKDKSVQLTPVVKKVASGAAETVTFLSVTNLARTLEKLKSLGVWLYGACGHQNNVLYDIDLKGHVAIVMGAEGEGLRRLTREKCDGLFSIPMKGTVESLNVSVATGVCLFEALRQRRT